MTEEIYGDVLFVVNFSMDFLGLFFAGRIMQFRLSPWRVIAGASLGALYGVVSLLFDLGFWLNHAVTFCVMLLMCAVSFRFGGMRSFLVTAVLYAGISMLIGGVMTAAFVKLGRYQTYIEIGGEIHTVYGDIPIWMFGVLAALSAAFTWLVGRLLRARRGIRNCEIKVAFDNKESDLFCLVDSGNLVTDPFSGTPVIFVKSEAARFLPDDILMAMTDGISALNARTVTKLRLIPTMTVAGESMITAAIPDRCYLRCKGEWESKRALVAVDFSPGDFSGYEALVPESLL